MLGLGFCLTCRGQEASKSAAGDAPDSARIEAELASPPETNIPRALWVLCEGSRRVLEDSARVEQLIEHASALGATDLFVQVYRGGRAWYDASLTDAAPYRALREKTGIDTLAQLIELAHQARIRVHAWVNVLSLSSNSDALLIRQLGRAAVQVDRQGRSLLDYPNLEVPKPDLPWYRMGTRAIYLDPGAPGVNEWLAAVFAELVTRYPTLDGLHLDYIRHPDVLPFIPGSGFGVGLDFGYGALSRERFRQETGLRAPFRDKMVNTNRWDAWRREQVTDLVARIRSAALSVREGLLISGAVISHTDRAYLTLAQDWMRWLEDGLLDLAVPMVYTRDDRLLRYQTKSFAVGPYAERIWPGLGAWLFAQKPERALAQVAIARESGAHGEALFSYDSIVESPELFDVLIRNADDGLPEVGGGG
ncbi:MAG: family 10 glycosylhydrolase [Myxococcota bacterium]